MTSWIDTTTLAQQQAKLNQLYNKNFGPGDAEGKGKRDASFDSKGGAQYWIDAHNPQSQDDWKEIDRMLAGSDEGLKFQGKVPGWTRAGEVSYGGIDPTKSLFSQIKKGDNTWLNHWAPGGGLAEDNIDDTFTAMMDSLKTANPGGGYFAFGEDDVNPIKPGGDDDTTGPGPGIDTSQFLKAGDLDAWWKGVDKPWEKEKSGGFAMDDFMKFMMFMTMLRPQSGGGGGSQYGYGGLNPGGVMSAYNPLDNITSAISAFQSLPGIGTGSVNTGTTTPKA